MRAVTYTCDRCRDPIPMPERFTLVTERAVADDTAIPAVHRYDLCPDCFVVVNPALLRLLAEGRPT